MISIGIDVGKHGAIAVIGNGEELVFPVPLVKAAKGKGRDEYDLIEIRRLLRAVTHGMLGSEILVTIEKAHPMPPKFGGGIANFNRGCSTGWLWMLTALGIPYQLVSPAAWMKVMHAGTPGRDTKQRSILAAQRLFPGVDLRRSDGMNLERARRPKLDDGFAEALLLAEYGRRTVNGK